MSEFIRKRLKHGMPSWVSDGQIYFITINASERGQNHFAKPDIAGAIKSAVLNYSELNKWYPKLVVVMPDHLHALFSLNTAHYSISQIISPWKSFLCKTQGIQWQEGFFEHRIRDPNSLQEKEVYLRMNPVRAGLVEEPEDWEYTWSSADFQR